MAIKGIVYALNGSEVTSPDEEVWTPITLGVSLTGEQKRSPYWRLEWRKTVADCSRLDWFDYENTVLSSLLCRPPGELDETEEFTDVVCQSVTFRQRRGVGNEVVATFLVYVG